MQVAEQQVTSEDMAYVLYRVQRAVRTLRRMPPALGRQKLTTWPDFVHEFWDAYGYSEPTPPRLVPTPRQISEMDEVLTWLAWLASERGAKMARIVWARGEGYGIRSIGKLCRCSHTWVRTLLHSGLWLLADRYIKNS